MSLNPADTYHEELRIRIRTLTSLLHGFAVQKSPSKQPQDILPFLRHFTTLLTCGDKDDTHAKKVIAVTGTINATNQVRALVVAQNPYVESSVHSLSLELIKKDERSFGEVVNGPSNASLVDHIADVWAALSAFDPRACDYQRQVESLELFFLSRSYRKFVVRFKEDVRVCGGRRLYDVIADWQPERSNISRKWVAPPRWLVHFQGVPPIESRTVQGQVQWAFSDDTKEAWSEVLEIILRKVDEGIEQVESAKATSGKNGEGELCKAMNTLNVWSRTLYYFVVWDAGVVKSLLTETDMVAGITTTFMPVNGSNSADETDDDFVELRQEPGESKGQQVFRYFKTVTAWHAAVHRLSKDTTLPELLKNLEIGLVEVPRSPSTVLTLPQISDAFFERFPDMTELREEVLNELKSCHSDTFAGRAHAEATLMGLVNYYGAESAYASHSAMVKNIQYMRNIVQPVADAGNAVVAVSQKCCWCCDWLGQNLEAQFKLPGTHGILFPWDPPLVGISVSVLERLEAELWRELHDAVSTALGPSRYLQHGSAASESEDMAVDEMFSDYVLEA